MKYAVIKLGGREYKVQEGDTILVDKLINEKPEPQVLLLKSDEKFLIGKPVLKDVTVTLKVLENLVKGEKIKVFKYKAKTKYSKMKGFRPQYSKLQVTKISE